MEGMGGLGALLQSKLRSQSSDAGGPLQRRFEPYHRHTKHIFVNYSFFPSLFMLLYGPPSQ